MKKPTSRNAIVMAILWLFAISLCALVLILMNLRGPMMSP
jgi:hypothetical protein